MDLNLVPMYQSLLVFSGASQPILDMILAQDWRFQAISTAFGDNCQEAGLCRFPREGLAFEHTLYADTRLIWDRATARGVNDGYRARGFAFADQPDAGGLPATDIFIDWYGQIDARWQYDAASGRYLRYTDGVAHFDAADGQQVWTDNVIIIEVEHLDRPDLFDLESRLASLDIRLEGQGRAYLFRDGLWYQGFWRRRSTDPGDALQLIYGPEISIMMKPGRTWVEVVRGMGDLLISDQPADMGATGTAIVLSATPTLPPSATP